MPWYSLMKRPHDVGRAVGVGAGVDLGAVAGREHDRLARDLARGQRRQRRVEAAAREVDALAQLDRRGAVADADGEEAHGLEVVAPGQEVADRHEVQQHDRRSAIAESHAARRPLQPIARRANSANE